MILKMQLSKIKMKSIETEIPAEEREIVIEFWSKYISSTNTYPLNFILFFLEELLNVVSILDYI